MKKMKPYTQKVTKVTDESVHYVDIRTWRIRRRWWTKARVPGTVRPSRLPGGSAFRNNWEV